MGKRKQVLRLKNYVIAHVLMKSFQANFHSSIHYDIQLNWIKKGQYHVDSLRKNLNFGIIDQSAASYQLCCQSTTGVSHMAGNEITYLNLTESIAYLLKWYSNKSSKFPHMCLMKLASWAQSAVANFIKHLWEPLFEYHFNNAAASLRHH